MHLRELQGNDHEALYALDVLCFARPFRFSRRAMRAHATAPNSLVQLVVEVDGRGETLLGFGIVHLEPGPEGLAAYVVTLDVLPEARGHGLATRLMRALQTAAAAAGAQVAGLHVFVGNEAAIRLYERLGYRRVGRVADFYGAGLDALEYRMALLQDASSSCADGTEKQGFVDAS